MNKRKSECRNFLEKRDWSELKKWIANERAAERTIISLTFDSKELICWRAVEAIGIYASEKADESDHIRRLLQSLLWTMNDESGALCWYAPQAIAEIIYNIPSLSKEFADILANYLDEEPFEAGVRYGIARIAHLRKEALLAYQEKIKATLSSSDDRIAVASVVALKALGVELSEDDLNNTQNSKVKIYDFAKGELVEYISQV